MSTLADSKSGALERRWDIDWLRVLVIAFYLIHQPVLVTIGYYVVQWNTSAALGAGTSAALGAGASILVKYVTIAGGTFMTTVILYELLVRRIHVMRFLFGMKPRQKLYSEETSL
jgi:glucan biosynthesis protein C